MQQIANWLQNLDLGQYAQRFAENDVNFAILADLTDQDLKEIGVASLGHRRQLLRAITELKAGETGTPKPATEYIAPVTPHDTAERRQVTVMFADLVGSTALSARMDPEDLREVIADYRKCTAETVRHLGGFVSQYLGDGVLVFFGYPQAHEDDAERAVRAGLQLVAAVAGLRTRASLQTRVGIATGLVVVGELTDAGGAQERGIIGETPNLAARLQSSAEPNQVIIAESTRRLLGNLFELKHLGARGLKGIAEPLQTWAVLRVSSVASRFEALHTAGLMALIGREEEVEVLLRRWSTAKTGEGQVVLLSGEAGIGKSRLTAELLERLAGEPLSRLRYFCSPQHTDSALYPIIGQMERAAGITYNDTLQTKLDKLDALLTQTATSIEDAELLADMLSLRNDGRYRGLNLSATQRRDRTLQALTGQIEALAQLNPVLMICEDAHWADPTSLEALGQVVNRIATRRVLLIVTFRPEFDAPWIGHPHVTALTINRLGQREVSAMIDRVVGNKWLAESVRVDIIERTDGIPLFVEELTKAVLEAESHRAEHAIAAIPPPALEVPASLHASLMARLDRLGPAKEVAQIGAMIGREFSHALIAAVARKEEPELQSALDRLIEAGLLFRQGVPPHATYLFKHALVRDAAYGTLLREPRRALHARIAETLESQFAEIAENRPELLARHCTEAGQIEKAAGLWGKAGQRSLERSALVEAAEQITRALEQIESLPATPELRREQIKLQVALITPLIHVKGWAAPETKAAAERARLLIEQAEARGEPSEDPLLLFSVLYIFWAVNYLAFNGDAMRELAAQFLTLAEKQGATTGPFMIGHRLMGNSLFLTGDLTEGRAHFDQALALYDPVEHRVLAARFSQDIRVAILCNRSWALWLLGYPDAALADVDHALEDAREIGQAATLLYALLHVSVTDIHCGNYATATAVLDELTALAGEKGALFWNVHGTAQQGCLFSLTGKDSDAIKMLTSGFIAIRLTGTTCWTPLYSSNLARAYVELGKFDDAWRSIGEAMTAVETTNERWCEAEVNRIAGEIALLSPKPDAAKAESYFERALAVAHQQQAKSWELRAAMSLARLWRSQGKPQQARELLAPVYGWFTEGFDTRDLKDAKALLDQLAS